MTQIKRNSKSGFTLIELLVVISIIALLTAVLTTVVGSMVTTARVKATRSTIKKVNEMLQRRMDAFEREMKIKNDKSRPDYITPWMSKAGDNVELAKIYGRKALFREYFSQIFSELDPILVPKTPADHIAATESSEVLYYFLTQKEAFGTPAAEVDSFISSEIQDTDGDGLMELVDAWGNPLRFYRWPTRLIKTNGTNIDLTAGAIILMSKTLPSRKSNTATTNMLNQDPDDPTGYIFTDISLGNTTAVDFENDFHTHDTWSAPLIVSMGPDEKLGLEEPNNGTEGRLAKPLEDADTVVQQKLFEQLLDNISNLNLESGNN